MPLDVELNLPPDFIPLSWHTERRKLDDLTILERNPFGKLDAKKKKRLEDKIKKLGVFEAPTVDTDGVLLTFNKRCAILRELGRGGKELDVMVPNRRLTEDERKEIILASNIHEGSWIAEILEEDFADIDVEALGLELDRQMEDVLKDTEKAPAEKPVYPIVAQFSEHYDAFVIVCSNDIDTNHIKEVLGLSKATSYKSETVGQTFVIPARDFINAWKEKESK